MDIKEFLSIILLFLMIFMGVACISTSYGANVDIISDFDNKTLTTVELSESQSKTIWGFENLAKVQTRTGGDMQNTHIETDEGLYNYEYMMLNDTIMEKNDRIYGKNGNQTLIAHYNFSLYAFAQIDIIDLHGHSGSSSTYPAMKYETDSITKTFKEYTDVETGYKPLYILDIDTNTKYQPGDKFTITYQDVANTGLTKMIKTFQYVYAKDIVIENIIIENRTIYNDTIINRDIFNDTIINRDIFNDTIIDRIIYNDTIINREIFNDTIINRIIFNDTIINRDIFNDTIIDRIIYNDTIINRNIFNDTITNRIIFNDTIINRDIFNDTIIDRIIYNDTIINRTIFNDTIVNRIIENITYVNKVIENITYVNKTIEIPKYVTKIIEIPKYVTKIVEIPEVENKTIIKNETKDIENVTKEIKVKEEIKNVPKIAPIKEVINEPVKQVVNNQNVTKNNAIKIVKVLNNNITKTNTTTNNINNENNTSTPTSNNIKTIKMKETGNTIAWIVLFIFIIALATFIDQDKD